MKYKKFIAGFVSMLLLAGNSCVYAAETQNTTQIEAACDLPEIKVTVPASGELFINPYEMPVEINGAFIGYQIVSTPTVIQNESVVPHIPSQADFSPSCLPKSSVNSRVTKTGNGINQK